MPTSKRALALLCVLLAGRSGTAKDFFLAVGGGPEPASSQISIENNVQFFLRTLGSGPNNECATLFASGPSELPDVCYTGAEPPGAVNSVLADILGPSRGMQLRYRHHLIGPTAQAATRSAVFKQISALAKAAKPNDRVLLYVTGHGSDGKGVANNVFFTWRRERVSVRDWVGLLDKFDPQVLVVTVMVQCYSGGFANLIFKDAEPAKGATAHRRAGFFATVENRPAAGCTPDSKPEDYHEYSTYFLGRQSQAETGWGAAVSPPDLDGDGKVSLAEAHARALGAAPTIDVSVKTSDAFLRRHGRLERGGRFFEFDRDFSRLSAVAQPVERHVLETLSKELKLNGENRIHDARQRLEQIEYQRKGDDEEMQRRQGEAARLARELKKTTLLARWPFLRNPWHPQSQQVLAHGSKSDVMIFLEKRPEFRDWKKARDLARQARERKLQAELLWAKHQRLIRAAQTVALAQNLRVENNPELLKRYGDLLAAEGAVLQPSPVAAPPPAAKKP